MALFLYVKALLLKHQNVMNIVVVFLTRKDKTNVK